MKKNKICVYTCITGNYDKINEIKDKELGIDYYLFTNNKNISSKTWKVIYIEDRSLTNVKLARKIKILGHELINDYDILLWMDAAIQFEKKIIDFIKNNIDDKTDFAAFKHGDRNSIEEEFIACVKASKETKKNVETLREFYREQKYKYDNGLIESTVFIKRPKSEIVKQTMNIWFEMVKKYSSRDQLSFNYCLFKTKMKVRWIKGKVFGNKWFRWNGHAYSHEIEKYRLYFGDQENYKLENDFQGQYIIDDNLYKIEVIVPENVKQLTIEPSHAPSTILKSIKINNRKTEKYELINSTKYKNYNLFYNENPTIIINKNFYKNKKLTIELEMEIADYNKVCKIVDYMSLKEKDYNNQIKSLKEKIKHKEKQINDLTDTLQGIYTSKTWRYIGKLKKIFGKQ